MALKRRIKKLTKSMVTKMTGTTFLACKECGDIDVMVPADTKSVVCADCVQKWISPPPNYKKEKSDKPRGWHFMMYFEHDGVVYSKGVEVTDADEIRALKKAHGSSKKKTVVKASKPKTSKKKTSKVAKVKKVPKKTVSKRGTKNARTSR